MNRDMLSRRLARKGYEIAIAVDGGAGVNRARSGRWEASEVLKKDESTRWIPASALTAHAMAEDRDRALPAGCDDYDTKPIELPRLLAKIEALLQR